MINYEYAEKFEQDSIHKDLVIAYEGGTITNTEMNGETFEFHESICSQNEFTLGRCEASYVQFSLGYGAQPMEGKELVITTTPDGGTPLPIGRFKVFSDTPTADRKWRDIFAYDKMYEILNTDVTAWYNGLFSSGITSIRLSEFRNSLFGFLGVTQESITLINDSMMIEKTIEPKELTGKDILLPLCEINGCFGRMTRTGTFQYVYLQPPAQGLFPEVTLYPAEDLYPIPNGNAQEVGKNGSYINAKYEDYIIDFITGLQIREKENDVGVTVGTSDNVYVIENNFLVYGKSTQDLTQIANKILNKIHWLYYTPAEIECLGNPCLQAGDGVKLVTKYAIVETFILQRTLKGIQALKDTYVSEGTRVQNTQKNGLQKELIQLKGKSNELEISIEETKSTITDVASGLQSQITQNAGSITAEVTRATTAESTITTNLNNEVNRATTKEGQLTTALNTEVTRAQTQESSLSSSIQALPNSIMAQVEAGYATKGSVTTAVADGVSSANGYTNTKLVDYDTSAEVTSKIQVSTQGILNTVSSTYYNQTEVDGMIDGLQAQIDNRTTLWTVDAVPTLSNYPANQWTTDADKDQHINDIAIVSTQDPQHAGENYRFEKNNGVYTWNIIQDTVATQALAKANQALQGVTDINNDLTTNYSTTAAMETIIDQKDAEVLISVGQTYETQTEVTRKMNSAVSTADAHTANTLLSYWTGSYTQSQIDAKAGEITSTVSQTYEMKSNATSEYSRLQTQITQNARDITSKVDADGIISTINQSAEQVSIDASKINLNGVVSANNNFKINLDGTMEAQGATLYGEVISQEIDDTDPQDVFVQEKAQLDSGALTIYSRRADGIINPSSVDYEITYDLFPFMELGSNSFILNCYRANGLWTRPFVPYYDKNAPLENKIYTVATEIESSYQLAEMHIDAYNTLSIDAHGKQLAYFTYDDYPAETTDAHREQIYLGVGSDFKNSTSDYYYYIHMQHYYNPTAGVGGSSASLSCIDSSSSYGWVVTGRVFRPSDERVKKNIKNITDEVIDAIGSVSIKQFIYKAYEENGDKEKISVGAVAQDVVNALKEKNLNWEDYEVVSKGELHYKLDYDQFLIARNAYLEKRVDDLEQRVAKLEKLMEGKQDE